MQRNLQSLEEAGQVPKETSTYKGATNGDKEMVASSMSTSLLKPSGALKPSEVDTFSEYMKKVNPDLTEQDNI